MSDKKEENWDFSLDESDLKNKAEKKELKKKSTIKKKPLLSSQKKENLALDTKAKPSRKSRTQMAIDEEGQRTMKGREISMRPSHFLRLSSYVLDQLYLSFLFGASTQITTMTPIFEELEKDYGLTDLSAQLPLAIADISLFVLLFVVLYIVPIGVWSTSPGKALVGLKIGREGKKSVGLINAFWREVIFKPITIVSFLGLLPILFSEKRKGLHDYLSGTYVTRLR